MIEAMACGTPVLAFRCGSVPEIIDPGVTGSIVRTMAEAIRTLPQVLALDRRTATVRAALLSHAHGQGLHSGVRFAAIAHGAEGRRVEAGAEAGKRNELTACSTQAVPVLDRRASNHLGRHPSAARIRRFRPWACLHEKCFGRSHPLTAGIDLIDTHLNWSGAAE
jgi:hypothetical protein